MRTKIKYIIGKGYFNTYGIQKWKSIGGEKWDKNEVGNIKLIIV
jgi:hypothetical protein